MFDGVDRKGHGGQHEDNGGNGSGLGKSCGRAARTKRRLAALAAKGRRDVPRLTALQEHDNDQKQADDYMDDSNENNHETGDPRLNRMSTNNSLTSTPPIGQGRRRGPAGI